MSRGRLERETAAGDVLAAAVSYAERGWRVFPVDGKIPLTPRGFKDATVDVGIVTGAFEIYRQAGVAIATGTVSGLVVLDEDTGHGGGRTRVELERQLGELPRTYTVLTGGGGKHFYFNHPGRPVSCSAGKLGKGVDVRGDGGYVVAPPSPHESGRPYLVFDDVELADLPDGWLDAIVGGRDNGKPAEPVADVIPEGKRRPAMLKVAGKLKRAGLTGPEILPTLRELNRRCQPPLDESELESVAFKTTIAPDPETAIRTAPVAEPRPIESVLDVFRSWLHLPDPSPVYVTCAVVAANRVEVFDPTWLILVGAAGSGKTEALNAMSQLDGVHVVGTLTEAALLSGTPRKDAAGDASGGLLREIGSSGIIVLKDFGSVLSMHRDARAGVIAAMRELYDGSWTRLLGTDGGRRLHWEGRVGLLAGATPVLDQHHAVMAQLGERFLIHRVAVKDAPTQGHSSLAHHGLELRMRREFAGAVAGLFAGLDLAEPPLLAADDKDRLVSLAVLVAQARSPVVRDGYSREVELVPDTEAPGRVVGALARLLTGLRMIGVDEAEAWRVTVKTGLDSMPATRRLTLEYMLLVDSSATTTTIATVLGLPTRTTRRVLEDLAAHGVIARESQGQGKADIWHVRPRTIELYEATLPDKSSSVISESHKGFDVSGTVGE